MKKSKFKKFLWIIATMVVLLNIVAALHAYKFTHFSEVDRSKTPGAEKITAADKFIAIFSGISNPRPTNTNVPSVPYETIVLASNRKIECWKISADSSIGTAIICHGYGGSKFSMMDKAYEFLRLHYSVLILDFMGSGGSEGTQTTIGYLEAEQVKTCYDYLSSHGEKNILLFGTSMGAVAIMKAVSDHSLQTSAIIIECPFGSLYATARARFEMMNIPSFPMAGLLVFWGGIENGFWAFDHKPTNYAKNIDCPTLLLYGEKDPKVSRQEIDEIFANITGPKQLALFPKAGHENYLNKYKVEWRNQVSTFLLNHK